MIKLNGKILEVLCMVYHYKHYRSAMASLYPEQQIKWYEDTKKFYIILFRKTFCRFFRPKNDIPIWIMWS